MKIISRKSEDRAVGLLRKWPCSCKQRENYPRKVQEGGGGGGSENCRKKSEEKSAEKFPCRFFFARFDFPSPWLSAPRYPGMRKKSPSHFSESITIVQAKNSWTEQMSLSNSLEERLKDNITLLNKAPFFNWSICTAIFYLESLFSYNCKQFGILD